MDRAHPARTGFGSSGEQRFEGANPSAAGPPVDRVLAIDVCGTLYAANTTSGLIAYHHARVGNRWRAALVRLASSRKLPFTYGFTLLSRALSFDLHRTLVVRSLRGERRGAIDESARHYVASLEPSRIEEAHRAVADLRAEGWRPILVSNSVGPVVRAVAAALEVPALSSELGWSGDRCTGTIAVDLTGRKRAALERHLGTALTAIDFRVITDNRSDIDLIDCAREPIVVLPRGRENWTSNGNARIIRT